ncbi:SIS domain-containing protein [Microbulbifer thermotolerans]|uniref:Phosphoheptose isomerase n=1 Tax=Microbulbifer thermotolerans TaxID=252514 RepID=A0A143HKL7_MICTH|nr:SIS domain-containing protein [Microbulbifer thermotolerans]AMX02051.1 phosphoheptose isomerase [Microbulbifer thermotolerans]MCX2780761.1 SIS domain-containing protein [Microbulbifer thermotolerans]MCX2781371.1 SIS domain-containing protein [Microbulbifer thermotolerans]MCX2793892.1 SIS domain-containing protein [Microbulbifer thermotolerans]MCX2800657.1 SIS domain-containing protein [Microbulbifer thermotolerans]
MEQRVVTLFHRSLEATMNAGEVLAPLVAEASEMVVHTLLAENKLLLCGNGVSGALAQSFCAQLLGGFQRERPGLPAIALNGDAVSMGTVSRNHGRAEIFARPVRALGQPGDLLVILSSDGRDSNLIQAMRAARDRDMGILALTGGDGGDCAALLDTHDIELRVPSEVAAEVHQVHLLTIFCLCDLIDSSLFGGYED